MKIEQLRALIDKYEAASAAIARNKSYTIDGLTYTRQDAAAIRSQLDALYSRLACLMRGGSCHRASPVRSIDHIKTWPWAL